MRNSEHYPLPETIRRLLSLKQGEFFVFYNGDLDVDTEHCLPVHTGRDANSGAPNYKSLLQRIKDIVLQLEVSGKIRVSVKPLRTLPNKNKPHLRVHRYTATGL